MIQIQVKKELLTSEGLMSLNLDLQIDPNSFITLFGKSGAGKTTTLRLLAGLTQPDSGIISCDETVWFDSNRKINLAPQLRKTGFVFQDYALFPNMTVRENIEFAAPKHDRKKLVGELIDIIDLGNLSRRYPVTLSGGQKQRVALARALARQPQLLLLDEPLAAIDREMRQKLQDVILNIHNHYKITTILVSHDLSEIFKLSNKVFLLDDGQIKISGIPADVFIGKKISGKFKFEGEILDICENGVVTIVTVSVGNNMVKVIATDSEAKELKVGNRVIVASKAFNPILLPVK